MPLEIQCTECNATFKVSEKLSGKRVKCRKCDAAITVRAPQAASGRKRRSAVPSATPAADQPQSDGELDFAALQKLESRGQALGAGKLIECSECGDVYGGESNTCVHCGAPNLEKQARRKKKKKKKSRQTGGGAAFFQGLKEFFYEYDALLRPLGFICVFLALCGGVIYLIDMGSSPTHGGRPQKEYGNRTTAKWLELEREGTARRVEVLWQDMRWMPLNDYLGLDWAAVPDLLNALTDKRSKDLAEAVLGKVDFTVGSPYVEDVEAGLAHADPLVRRWAARLASKLTEGKEKVLPTLEQLSKDPDAEVSKAATEALAKLKSSG